MVLGGMGMQAVLSPGCVDLPRAATDAVLERGGPSYLQADSNGVPFSVKLWARSRAISLAWVTDSPSLPSMPDGIGPHYVGAVASPTVTMPVPPSQ